MFQSFNKRLKSEDLIIQPHSPAKKVWEYIGLFLLVAQLLYEDFDLICILSDIYFVVDIIIRFRTGYYNNKGNIVMNPKHIARRYIRTWLIFDIFVSLPYQIMWLCWNARPVHKLLSLRNTPRPLLKFITKKTFRIEVLQTFRAHLKERTWLYSLFNIKPLPLPIKIYKWLGLYIKGKRHLELMRNWSTILRTLITIATSLRVISMFSMVFR